MRVLFVFRVANVVCSMPWYKGRTKETKTGAYKGKTLLDAIDARTADWPRSAKAQWGFLKTAVKPQGAGRYVRDAQFAVIGAAVASLAWYFFGR